MVEPLLAFKIVTILLIITLINAQKQLVSAQDTSNFLTGTVTVITNDCYQVNACLNTGGGNGYTVVFTGYYVPNGDVPLVATGISELRYEGESNATMALGFSSQVT